MQIPGFQRDPIRDELRRLTRESSRMGHTARRLVEESTVVASHHIRTIHSVRPHSQVKPEPILRIEGRLARRKVLLAALVAGALAWILFRLVAGWSG